MRERRLSDAEIEQLRIDFAHGEETFDREVLLSIFEELQETRAELAVARQVLQQFNDSVDQ